MNRAKPPIFTTPASFTDDEHQLLKTKGAADKHFWDTKVPADKAVITKFKNEIKDHYWNGQLRRCCYCSSELQSHKATYDAEHIIDKSGHPQFMFEYTNLAVACKVCNRGKWTAEITVGPPTTPAPPSLSNDYTIVHPHLDEWHDHLEFDRWNRIQVKANSSKGTHTIDVCKIHNLNAARLADRFATDRKEAENYLRQIYAEKIITKKEAALALLRKLADQYNLPQAKAVVGAVEEEVLRIRQESEQSELELHLLRQAE